MMKLMIVDDNKKMRDLIRLYVQGDAVDIVECSDGVDAVSSFELFHPDVVLMDIEMKEMDGFTATEKIYQCDPTAKVIFVSNYNSSAFRTKATLFKAKGFVPKDNLAALPAMLHS